MNVKIETAQMENFVSFPHFFLTMAQNFIYALPLSVAACYAHINKASGLFAYLSFAPSILDFRSQSK